MLKFLCKRKTTFSPKFGKLSLKSKTGLISKVFFLIINVQKSKNREKWKSRIQRVEHVWKRKEQLFQSEANGRQILGESVEANKANMEEEGDGASERNKN